MDVNAILQVVPNTWNKNESYTGRNYVTVEITQHGTEYQEIEQEIEKVDGRFVHKISKIERVQHPFAFGRFLLRKEQYCARGYLKRQERVLIRVRKSAVPEALEYNVDERRTKFNTLSSYFLPEADRSDYCIIVLQSLYSNIYCITRDSEMYPEYVIYFE